MAKVVVVIENGIVVEALSSDPDTDVSVIDMDVQSDEEYDAAFKARHTARKNLERIW